MGAMFATPETAAAWDEAYERFEAAKEELRAEQNRLWNTARDDSFTMQALEIFPL